MLAKRKVNTFETIISEFSHEEFKTIVNEEKVWKMNEDIRMLISSDKLNKEKGKKIRTTKLWVKIVKMISF